MVCPLLSYAIEDEVARFRIWFASGRLFRFICIILSHIEFPPCGTLVERAKIAERVQRIVLSQWTVGYSEHASPVRWLRTAISDSGTEIYPILSDDRAKRGNKLCHSPVLARMVAGCLFRGKCSANPQVLVCCDAHPRYGSFGIPGTSHPIHLTFRIEPPRAMFPEIGSGCRILGTPHSIHPHVQIQSHVSPWCPCPLGRSFGAEVIGGVSQY